MVHKYEKDGKVAVLYSRVFGSGWSSSADPCEKELLLFDPEIAEIVLEHKHDKSLMMQKVRLVFAVKNYQSYFGDGINLCVEMIPKGQLFRIDEYDGYESIIFKEDETWHTA